MLGANATIIRNKLFRVAYRILGNSSEAEDVAQEVLVKLYQHNDIELLRSVEAYAVTMAKNLCMDIKRKNSRVFNVELSVASGMQHGKTPESLIEDNEVVTLVRNTINQLSDSYKMVIHLRDIEEMEFSEIAEIMQMNENQVRVTLSRARKRLKEAIVNNQFFEYEKGGRVAR